MTDKQNFRKFEDFTSYYGPEPHLGCYLIGVSRGWAEGWQVKLIVEERELREVVISIASKQQLGRWCKKSIKIVRWNQRQILGDKLCRV